MSKIRRCFVALLFLSICAPLPAVAQDAREQAERALEKNELYLARKPYQDWALDKLVESAVSLNRLDDLVHRYESRVASEPKDEPSRIVLARLYARVDRLDQALEVLPPIAEHADAELGRLRGELLMKAGKVSEASAALDAAARATSDAKLLEGIHSLRGEVFLASGDRAGAQQAFHALAELDPESFSARMAAAETLARHGLTEEALAEYAIAKQLAGEDSARTCRVLADIGRLDEQLARGPDALAAYAEAIAQMARGNWLKRELEERVLALHERTGELAKLVEHAREQVQARPDDLDARELLSRALEKSGAKEEALAVLDRAVEAFAGDPALSQHRRDLLRSLGMIDALIAEYQRILVEHPEELELHLELGQLFASEGRLEQARIQWNRTLEKHLDDAGLCSRLAGFYALYDHPDDALAMYERAIAIEPDEIAHYADVVRFLTRANRSEEIPALLERAEQRSVSRSSALEEVAALWNESGHPDRGLAALQRALALEGGDDPRLLGVLAQALIDAADYDAAGDALHRVIELAGDSTQRANAADRLITLFRKREKLDELLALEEERVSRGETKESALLVLAKIHVLLRESERALKTLEELLALDASNEAARLLFARLHEEAGDFDLALADYEKLSELRPQNRRRYLKEMARIHLALFDQERAFACFDEILRSAPDNPASFQEVADAYERLGLHEKVVELLRHAIRLRPEDGRVRLDLAETYAVLGEHEKAREEVHAAIASSDAETRSKARERYYSMLAEAGEVEAEIDALRERIEKNPYDVEAPLVLADLYVRESEYGLAIEMLDGLLAYQPREPQLLTQRAELYVLVERYEEAIRDLETLWKVPDADHDRLGLAIAGAALSSGDRRRAMEVLSSIGNAMQVAGFWSDHEEPREAVVVLEQALQRAPADARIARELVRRSIEVGDREKAVEHLERLLDSTGDSWSTLVRLGEVYHALGRTDDAIACGRRLFGLLRVEEEKAEREEEEKKPDPYAQIYGPSWRAQGMSQRISELQTYFSSKGMTEQFGRIGAEEVVLQPTNNSLLGMVVSNLTRQDGQGPLVSKTVASVREATLGKGRLPPGIDAESWERSLSSYEMGCYRKDAAFAGARIAELAPGVEASTASERDVLELATLCSLHRRESEQIAALEAALASRSDSKPIAAGLASAWMKQKEYVKAAGVLEGLLASFDESAARAEYERKFETDLPRARTNLLAGLSVQARRRVSDADVVRVLRVSRSLPLTLGWSPGETIYPQGVRRALATCYAKTARADMARTMLGALEPEEPEAIAAWTQIANAYYEEELYPEAESIYRRLLEILSKLTHDPVLGWISDWSNRLASPMANFARILERRGEIVEAYDLLRTYGDPKAAELLLHTHEAFAATGEHYRSRMEAEEASWQGAVPPDKSAWREAAVRLAETYQLQKEWRPALAAYERVAAELPDDVAVRDLVAAIHLRTGDADRAIEERRAIIATKRELNRTLGRQETPPIRTTIPQPLPSDDGQEDYVWSNLRNRSSYSSSIRQWSGAQTQDVTGDYAEMLKIHLDRRELPEAARILRDLAREDAQTFRWLRYSLAEILRSYRFGVEALPVYRLMQSTDASDDSFDVEYAQALVQAGDLEEARRILVRTLTRGTDEWRIQDARTRLTELERRTGTAETGGVETLESAVAADPKSIKKRLELARKLFEDRRVEDALMHVNAAEELAPNQEEVLDLVTRCHQALGHHDEVEASVLAAFQQEGKPERKLALATRLAGWMWERGERDKVDELFQDASRAAKQSWRIPTPAAWYLERGDYEKARSWLEKSIESYKQSGITSSQDPKQDLVRLRMIQGDGRGLLLDELHEIDKRETMAEKLALIPSFIAHVAELPRRDEERIALEAAFAAEAPADRRLLEAAFAIAARDVEGGERVLSELVHSEIQARFLYPFLVTLARARADWRSALGYLEEIERENLASPTIVVGTRVGMISEAQALQGEMGELLARMGELDRAREKWNAMFEPGDAQAKRKLASLYADSGLTDEALTALREFLLEFGERDGESLKLLAELCGKAKRYDEQIVALRKVEVLTDEHRQFEARPVHDAILGAYRRADKLTELRDELERALQKDPGNAVSQRELLALDIELGDDDAARALMERLAEQADAEPEVLSALAEEKRANGDVDGAILLYERLLTGKGNQWERRAPAQLLAQMLADKGEIERAIEILRSSTDDPEGAEAAFTVAEELRSWNRPEEALAYFRKGIALTESEPWRSSSMLELLVELGHHREALDAFYANLAKGEDTSFLSLDTLASMAVELGESERLAAELASAPEDPVLLLRAGIIAYVAGDDANATARFEAILARAPENREALTWLIRCHERAKREPEALALCERLLPLLDRDRAFHSRADLATQQIENLRRERVETLLRAGRVQEARAAAVDRLGRRYEEVSIDGFTSFRLPTSDLETYGQLCRGEGLWDEAADVEGEICRKRGRVSTVSLAKCLQRKGDIERAKGILWASLRPPVSRFLGVAENESSLFVDYGSADYGDGDAATSLMQIAREEGTVDAFLREFEELVAGNPEDEALATRYLNILQQSGRWESLLALLEKRSPPDALVTRDLGMLAQIHQELGHYEKATELYERQVRLERARRWSGDGEYMVNTTTGLPTNTRFTWGAQGARMTSGSSSSWSGSQWYASGANDRDAALVALHAKLGHTDRAAELERALFTRLDPRYQDASASWVQLAHAHAKLELWKEAEEYLRRGLADVKPASRDPLHEALLELCARRGDAEAQRTALSDWVKSLDERLAEDPRSATSMVQRALARARFGGDKEAARADLERALEIHPEIEEYDPRVAWIRLELGEEELALAIFRRMENRSYQWRNPETSYGLGLAVAAVEGVEAARPTLRRALAEDPENVAAARARALLQ